MEPVKKTRQQLEKENAILRRQLKMRGSDENELQMFRSLAEYSAEAIGICSPDKRILFANRKMHEIFGYDYDHEEMIGISAEDCFLEEDLARFYEEIWPQGSSCIWNGVVKQLRKDGSSFISEGTASAIFDYHQQVIGLAVFIRDISARQAMDDRLRKSEESLRALLDAIPESAVLADVEGTILSANQRFAERFNTKVADLIGTNAAELLPEEMKQERLAYLQKVIETRKRQQFADVRDNVHYAHFISPVLNEKGEVERMALFSQDITERVMSEEILEAKAEARTRDLARANAKLRAEVEARKIAESERERMFNMSIDMIATFKDGYFIEVNSALVNISGWSEEELRSRNARDFVHPDDLVRLREAMSKLDKGQPLLSYDVRFRCKDGSYIWVSWNAVEDRDSGKIYSIGRDITEQIKREAEEQERRRQLIQADKMISLGILVSGVAHEVNNPNHSILTSATSISAIWNDVARLLDARAKAEELTVASIPWQEIREAMPRLLNIISRSSDRIKHIVRELRDFARHDPGYMSGHVNLNSVIQSAITLLSNMLENEIHSFSFTAESSLPDIRGNFRRLEQVMINLIQNACQAVNRKEGTIEVVTAYEANKDRIKVTVSDNGPGIPEPEIGHVTDPFYTTKRDSGGTGLGLSIASSILQDHRATMEFQSRVGQGTRVILYFPVEENKKVGVKLEVQYDNAPGEAASFGSKKTDD